jgi:hypothetical protein
MNVMITSISGATYDLNHVRCEVADRIRVVETATIKAAGYQVKEEPNP